MGEKTKIQWCDHTFNPWRGCTKVSPGCTFCYADRQSKRNPRVLGEWGPKGTRVLASRSTWNEPTKWNREHAADRSQGLVFCASLADVFEDWPGQMQDHEGHLLGHDDGDEPWGWGWPGGDPYTLEHARQRLWQLIRDTPSLTWQLLTKRPENVAHMMPRRYWPNVWLGTSVETQEYVWRLDALQEAAEKVRVPVLFCSAEPLLGPLLIRPSLGRKAISWVIVGGESGGQSRPLNLEWVASLIDQCSAAGVACFVKQMGRVALRRGMALKLVNDPGHGGDPEDWPEGYEVREFPNV